MATTGDPVSSKFESELGDLKLERITATGEAAAAQVSIHSLLQHEALRIETKLGSKHPRTVQLKARLQANLQVIHTLEVERQLARIEAPEIVQNGALIHGRIVDEDGLGIDRLSVAFVDRHGAPTRDAHEQATDASGYFAISIDPEAVDRLLKQSQDGIFLAVFTPRRRLVHQEAKPLALVRGVSLFVEVRLSRGDLTATPSQPRDLVAVPGLIGLVEADALAALQRVGLKLGERETLPALDQVGRVLAQAPTPGTKVDVGSSVSLVIGVQSKTVRVPSVVALTLKDAGEAIKKSGLILGKVSGTSSAESIVRDQDPKPDTEVPAGTQVNVTVAPPAKTGIKELLKRMVEEEGFDEIGISADDLEKRLETAAINTKEQMASLLEREDSDLKSSLGLPNQKAAKILKRVLRKALKED
ncbi:MAG TPA: PASTA domain-containing protein [Blastocatellia bacterium]|nr:PASTA domain-containing protein [Blastocatellia bacterium]